MRRALFTLAVILLCSLAPFIVAATLSGDVADALKQLNEWSEGQ